MTVDHVDIVCDHGIWHEHRPGHGKKVSRLARFTHEEDPKKADVPGWRLIPKKENSGTPGQIARSKANRAKASKDPGVVGFDEETGEIVNGLIPTVWIFPCECGWPTFAFPDVEDIAELLDQAAALGTSRVSIDDLNKRAPKGSFLAHYAPKPSADWETFARLTSTKSHVQIEPPDDSECFATEDREGRWLQVVCDGGAKRAEWHRKHGARVIAGFMGEENDWDDDENDWDDDEDRYPYAMLTQEAGWPIWGVEEWESTYVFHPCPCGREFPTMKRAKVHRVMEKLARQRCHAVTVDTFLKALPFV